MTYTIDVENIDRVLYAHIHQGSSDENGDIVVTLFNPSSPTAEVSGELAMEPLLLQILKDHFKANKCQT